MTGGVWIASYVLLWIAVVVLAVAVVVLLRRIEVLHGRLRATGVDAAGGGPCVDTLAPAQEAFDFASAELTLLAFTAPGCELCTALVPSLRAFSRAYPEVSVALVEQADETAGIFRAYYVRSTPYVVAVDRRGVVRGAGVTTTLEDIEVLIASARTGA